MQKGMGKLKEKVANGQDKPVQSQGYAIQGSFGVAGISALVKGATYLNKGDEVCPWSPGLIDFLLVYGSINVALPSIYGIVLLIAYFLRKSHGPKILKYNSYIPYVSTLINFGLIIWGFVLLYSPSDSVTYKPGSVISPNKNYCESGIYIFSMIIVYVFVGVSVITTIVHIIRYRRAMRNPKSSDEPYEVS